ncbi:MAG: GNAT family N-acetyltransferase [Lachnospiraceae bacterium]
MMENSYIKLIPADLSLAEQAADYYQKNREFLKAFEPARSEDFFSASCQREILQKEMKEFEDKTAFHFYIIEAGPGQRLMGKISLTNVVWGAFCSAFLGYKLDAGHTGRGYMSMAVEMLVRYAFEELRLHRIEANVMPRNAASLRLLEKNDFINEGLSKYYLKINGVWEDHIHMVKLNDSMHDPGGRCEPPDAPHPDART